ncbi:hypothetical protein Tco_0883387 [Tanacetum coccineum]
MMLLARAITQKFSTPTNNRLCTSSKTRNQAVIQDGRVDTQTKNASYGGNGNRNAGRQNRNQAFNAGTRNDESNQIVQRVPQTKSNLGKANVQCYNFGSNLKDEENDFMIDNSYGDETLEELTVAVIMMARIQSADDNAASEPSYDAKVVSELGYKNPEHLKKVIAAQPKIYDGEMLHNTRLKIDSPDSEETLEDAEESRLKMRNKMVKLSYEKLNPLYETFVPQQEPSVEQTYFSIPSNCSETKEVTFDLSILKIPKEMDSVVKERENIKLEYQKLFNSIKVTETQHQKELDKLIEHVNQKTYAYADVRAQNQVFFMTISEFKNKLKTIDKGKNVNTKFDKFEISGTLLCETPLPKNIAVKAKKVSNTKVNADRSKPVTSQSIPTNEQSQKQSANVITRGMYRITKIETQTLDSKSNINVSISIVIMEYLVKISKKARILELKRRHLKITVLTSYTPYSSRKIQHICACTSQKTTKE